MIGEIPASRQGYNLISGFSPPRFFACRRSRASYSLVKCVCVAFVAVAGRRYTYTVCTHLLTYLLERRPKEEEAPPPPTHNREPYDTLL